MENERRSISLDKIQAAIDVSDVSATSCPFIGTSADRKTPMAFPHRGNRCYRHLVGITRELPFQSSYCLSEAYVECSIYQHEELQIDEEEIISDPQKKTNVGKLAVLLAIVMFAFAVLIFISLLGWYTPSGASSNLPTRNSADDLPASNNSSQADTPAASQTEQPEIGPADVEPLDLESDHTGDIQTPKKEGTGGFRAIIYPPFPDE